MSGTALITGVSGFAGRHLAERLLVAGWDVAGTVHTRTSGLEDVQEHKVEADDDAGLAALITEVRPDVVYHLAAIVDTVQTPSIPALYRINTLGTVAVLEAIRVTSSVERVVIASSAFAYGQVDPGLELIPESTPLRPLTAYGSSKAAAEAIALQWWRASGTDLVITRAFQHTGPGHVGQYALADWASRLARGSERLDVGNLDVVRDYLDVRDVVAAYEALARDGRPGEVYNVASGVPRTMRSMLEGLVRAFGSSAEIVVDPDRVRAVDQPVFVADVSKLLADTEWRPAHPMDDTLRDLAESTCVS